MKQYAFKLFLTGLYSLGVEGVPPHQRYHQIPSIAQTSMPNYDLFPTSSLDHNFEEMTIKHFMYMQKVPFLYTERACVGFSGFEIFPGRVLMLNEV